MRNPKSKSRQSSPGGLYPTPLALSNLEPDRHLAFEAARPLPGLRAWVHNRNRKVFFIPHLKEQITHRSPLYIANAPTEETQAHYWAHLQVVRSNTPRALGRLGLGDWATGLIIFLCGLGHAAYVHCEHENTVQNLKPKNFEIQYRQYG